MNQKIPSPLELSEQEKRFLRAVRKLDPTQKKEIEELIRGKTKEDKISPADFDR